MIIDNNETDRIQKAYEGAPMETPTETTETETAEAAQPTITMKVAALLPIQETDQGQTVTLALLEDGTVRWALQEKAEDAGTQ